MHIAYMCLVWSAYVSQEIVISLGTKKPTPKPAPVKVPAVKKVEPAAKRAEPITKKGVNKPASGIKKAEAVKTVTKPPPPVNKMEAVDSTSPTHRTYSIPVRKQEVVRSEVACVVH